MGSKSQDLFLTIRSEGAILPPDLLQRIVAGDRELDGLKADDYHLPKGEKINEATSRAWNRLLGVWASFRAAAEKLPETDPTTTVTRERWLQPFFQELAVRKKGLEHLESQLAPLQLVDSTFEQL